MIIQSVPEGRDDGRQFVVRQYEHQSLCGQFVLAFGNDDFEEPDPFDEVVFAVSNHDQGWYEADFNPQLDPESRMPYNVLHTARPTLFKTSSNSPAFNEKRHPYCGLMSSMHSWGLYNGRYGVSNKVLVKEIAPEHEKLLEDMLDGELERQERLKKILAADKKSAPWIEETKLLDNYKLLQFFDTLALYLNLTPEGERGETTFINVPQHVGDDTDVVVKPLGDGVYSMDPFPFHGDSLEVHLEGRYLTPYPEGEEPDLAAVMRDTPTEQQITTFVRA